jgi:hypothetical protein
MILSAALCAANATAYLSFFARWPGHGNLSQALWPTIYMVSSVLEAGKLGGLTVPLWVRYAPSGMILCLGAYQLWLILFYYAAVQRRLEKGG